MIVVDTSIVVAALNRGDDAHETVRDWLTVTREELVTTPLAVAEMDHLVSSYGGEEGVAALRGDLKRGAYVVDWWPAAMSEIIAVASRHAGIGLTDASLVALAARVETIDVATLDERHFRTLRPATGEPAYRLLPADA